MNNSLTDFKIGGRFKFEQIRDGKVIDSWEDKNLIVDQGLNYTLNAALSNGTVSTTWYLGVFKNNYTPIAADVMATFPGSGVANEVTTDYSESTRPLWVDAGAVSQSITNNASPASFSFTTTSTTVYGAFLSSSNVKGGTTGTLFAASKFSASRTLLAGDTLNVVYTVNSSSI